MRRSHILKELRAADYTWVRANRERPNGLRCPLDDRRGGDDLTIEKMAWAEDRIKAVADIPDPLMRDVVSMAMAMGRDGPIYTQQQIAAKCQCSLRTVERKLSNGIKQVANSLAHCVPVH